MADPARARERIGVVGSGYVGATTAAAMLLIGNQVAVIERDEAKIERFRAGDCPVDEPGIGDALADGYSDGRVSFDSDLATLGSATIVFVCVPTPQCTDGRADTSMVEQVSRDLADHLSVGAIVVVKSTVPIGTADRIRKLLAQAQVDVVSNPEFLREGHALHDFLRPSRIVVGGASSESVARVAALYAAAAIPAPMIRTDSRTAELAKYASNGYLAVKLSFVNELAELADAVDADIATVTDIMGLDPRIGPTHLTPSCGWGGSCLPKDARALVAMGEQADAPQETVRSAIVSNEARLIMIAERLVEVSTRRNPASPTVGVLGLSFKPGSADLAMSPSLRIVAELLTRGMTVVAHDPSVHQVPRTVEGLRLVDNPTEVLERADATTILTPWPCYWEFVEHCDLVPSASFHGRSES